MWNCKATIKTEPQLPPAQMQRSLLPQLHHSGASADGTGYWWLLQQSHGRSHPTGGDAAAAPCTANTGTPGATETFTEITFFKSAWIQKFSNKSQHISPRTNLGYYSFSHNHLLLCYMTFAKWIEFFRRLCCLSVSGLKLKSKAKNENLMCL